MMLYLGLTGLSEFSEQTPLSQARRDVRSMYNIDEENVDRNSVDSFLEDLDERPDFVPPINVQADQEEARHTAAIKQGVDEMLTELVNKLAQ